LFLFYFSFSFFLFLFLILTITLLDCIIRLDRDDSCSVYTDVLIQIDASKLTLRVICL
jgi:hypothetical protein